jgi:crossover junction endonuclease EME1
MDIDTHVLRLKSKFEGCSPIYLIEGLGAWMRKNNNIRNRAFQAAVLYQGDENINQNDPQGGGSRRKKLVQQYVDADMIEDALLRVQVVHKCLIHHTATAVKTAEWVSNFTQHISTIPYRYACFSSSRAMS